MAATATPPHNRDLPTGHTDSPLLAAPVAGMAVRSQEHRYAARWPCARPPLRAPHRPASRAPTAEHIMRPFCRHRPCVKLRCIPVGAAHGRDRNTPGNGSIPTGHTDSPPLAAPVAGMARSYKETVHLSGFGRESSRAEASTAKRRSRLKALLRQLPPD